MSRVEISPIVNAVVIAIVLAIGGAMLASVQGHAEADDVARIEKRVDATEKDLKAHLKDWQKEQVAQAAFRAALVERMKLKLPTPEG